MNRYEQIIAGITETGENEQFLLATQPSKKPKLTAPKEAIAFRFNKTQPDFTHPVKSHTNGATTASNAQPTSATASPQSGIGRFFPAASQPSKKRTHDESTELAGLSTPLVPTPEPSTPATTVTLEVVNNVGIVVPEGESVISQTVAQPEPTVANKVPEVMQLDPTPVVTESTSSLPPPQLQTSQPITSSAVRPSKEEYVKDVATLEELRVSMDAVRERIANANRQNVLNLITREKKIGKLTLEFDKAEFIRQDDFEQAELKRKVEHEQDELKLKTEREKDLDQTNKAIVAEEAAFAEWEKAQKEEKKQLTKELDQLSEEISQLCKRTGATQRVCDNK